MQITKWEFIFGFALTWSSILAWLGLLVLVVRTVLTVSRWGRTQDKSRNPTNHVAMCIVVFLFFLLFEANTRLRSEFVGFHLRGEPEPTYWLLLVAHTLLCVAIAAAVTLSCAVISCVAARRLPNISTWTLALAIVSIIDYVATITWFRRMLLPQ